MNLKRNSIQIILLLLSFQIQPSQSEFYRIERNCENEVITRVIEDSNKVIKYCENVAYVLTHDIKEGVIDPFNHYVKIVSGENIVLQEVFYSSESDDVNFFSLEELPCLVVIEYYSSSVGYLEYYVLELKSQQMYKTEKLDELEELIISSINIEEEVVKTKIGERKIIRSLSKLH